MEINIREKKVKSDIKPEPKAKLVSRTKKEKPITRIGLPFPVPVDQSKVDFDLYRFIQIPPTEEVPYSFYIGKYPVTNAQYERFLNAPDYSDASHWRGFPKFIENGIPIGRWHDEGWIWYQEQMKDPKKFLDKQRIVPEYWNDQDFGIANPEHPAVGITWYEASAYCSWLMRHWNGLAEALANLHLYPKQIRLPLDSEWSVAAGGERPDYRYPWDIVGKVTKDIKEIVSRANVSETHIGHTTPVNAFLRGTSTHGVLDMAGNVWEWQANYRHIQEGLLSLRGGSWNVSHDFAYASICIYYLSRSNLMKYDIGFRVVCILSGSS